MGVHAGLCSWTDPTLIKCGRFYPAGVTTPEQRLRHYAAVFDTVEVDSSFYHLPNERNSFLWAERTPDAFRFHIKAYRSLTLHDREHAPTDQEWTMFSSALQPLRDAGKLGYVLFQYAPWFRFGDDSFGYMRECIDRMGGDYIAIQFRHSSFLLPENRDETFGRLKEMGAIYVAVDEPQLAGRTIPPVTMVTVPRMSVIRLNGRNSGNWFARDIPVVERFHYRYQPGELAEWTPRVRSLAESAEEVYVMFNNCFEDDAAVNARQMIEAISGAPQRTSDIPGSGIQDSE
jgi:uncharacterized protein YecE (DUF72 family)